MFTLRKSADRGHADHGWLNSFHTFSFGDYHDPAHMGFRNLRVINEDRVLPGQGFGTHGHRDMEIVSVVLSGSLEHKDSMGNGSVIRAGDVQRMSAGTGVQHSERNPSPDTPVHFLQIWLFPTARNMKPGYEQKGFLQADGQGRFRLVASPDGRDGSVTIHSDASLWIGHFAEGERTVLPLPKGRHTWLQVATGTVEVNGHRLGAGDAVACADLESLTVVGVAPAQVLAFDLD